MGYDMHWKTRPAGEEEAVAAVRELFYAACSARDALPQGSRGEYSEDEWKRIKSGEMGHDDYPANVTDEYRAAQDEVRRLSRELDKVNRSYFRLNIFGMSKVRDAMEALDVCYDNYSTDERPDYPSNVPDEFYDDEDDSPQFAGIREQIEAYLSWSPRDPEHGIPVHKLCSNDGWHVLPEEAFVAASKVRAADPQVVLKTLVAVGINNEGWLERWNDWIQWLADASEHGGFAVH
jgi:hypothetical protein